MEAYRFDGSYVAGSWGVYQPVPANETDPEDFFNDKLKTKAVVSK